MIAANFKGKTVLVTGGSQGIGKAIAAAFAAQKANVVISARNPEPLARTAAELERSGGQILAISADVSNVEQVASLYRQVQESIGIVEILVNNAGAAESHPIVDHPDELWERMLAINLSGTFYVSRAFIPSMLDRKNGRVINIASTAGKVGGKYIAAYAAAKHGVIGLTRSMAAEFADRGITVNAICPGYVATPMTHRTIENIVEKTEHSEEEALETIEAKSPQNRLIQPSEIAHLALMLAGDEAAGINGQAINIDGGAVMD